MWWRSIRKIINSINDDDLNGGDLNDADVR